MLLIKIKRNRPVWVDNSHSGWQTIAQPPSQMGAIGAYLRPGPSMLERACWGAVVKVIGEAVAKACLFNSCGTGEARPVNLNITNKCRI